MITDKEIGLLKSNKKQITIKNYNDGAHKENAESESDADYQKNLLKTLIENEKDKTSFQNTKNNVRISNTHTANSKMCSLM